MRKPSAFTPCMNTQSLGPSVPDSVDPAAMLGVADAAEQNSSSRAESWYVPAADSPTDMAQTMYAPAGRSPGS